MIRCTSLASGFNDWKRKLTNMSIVAHYTCPWTTIASEVMMACSGRLYPVLYIRRRISHKPSSIYRLLRLRSDSSPSSSHARIVFQLRISPVMDSSSRIHGYTANSNGGGFMCGYAARCIHNAHV